MKNKKQKNKIKNKNKKKKTKNKKPKTKNPKNQKRNFLVNGTLSTEKLIHISIVMLKYNNVH